jgi:hypothetical protein
VSPVSRRQLAIGAAFLLASLLLLLAESWFAEVGPPAHPKRRLTSLVPVVVVSVLNRSHDGIYTRRSGRGGGRGVRRGPVPCARP